MYLIRPADLQLLAPAFRVGPAHLLHYHSRHPRESIAILRHPTPRTAVDIHLAHALMNPPAWSVRRGATALRSRGPVSYLSAKQEEANLVGKMKDFRRLLHRMWVWAVPGYTGTFRTAS